MWNSKVLTLFPEIFPGPLGVSITGRALEKKIWSLDAIDIRGFSQDKHQKVDDSIFGGGVGMVIRPDVVDMALRFAYDQYDIKPIICYLTPRGLPLNQNIVRDMVTNSPQGIIILCGRYEGIDERVIEHWKEKSQILEISMGDYILSGGEIAALAVIDACVRLLPNVLIKPEATDIESFTLDLLEFPHYTKPRIWNNKIVPDVLLSGDHKKIADWRKLQAENITKHNRPDLWKKYVDSKKH